MADPNGILKKQVIAPKKEELKSRAQPKTSDIKDALQVAGDDGCVEEVRESTFN